MNQNNKLNQRTSIIAGIISVVIVLLFGFVNIILPKKVDPNVFLQFQYNSNNYYKIIINDSLIIDSEGIKRLKYKNEYYKTKELELKLDKGNHIIQIKDSTNRILSESKLMIDNLKPKYIYLRKEIVIRDKPYKLI